MMVTLVKRMQVSFCTVFVIFVKVHNYCVKLLQIYDAFIKCFVLVDFGKRNEITFSIANNQAQIEWCFQTFFKACGRGKHSFMSDYQPLFELLIYVCIYVLFQSRVKRSFWRIKLPF